MSDFQIPDDELLEESSAEELKHWKLTAGQSEALEKIRSFTPKSTTGCDVGIVDGHAGTGKSTMLRYLAQDDKIFVLCPTGKAAVRVKEVAGCDAMTIHRWLYTPVVSEFGEVESWALNTPDNIQRPPNNILLIDEASMVTQTIYEDLLSICSSVGINIVFIGDSYQLPPVETRKSNFSVFNPETPHCWKVRMTEVLRQARDSVVLRAATAVREGAPLYEAFSELEIIAPESFNEEVVKLTKSQGFLICHTNKTRQELNVKIRSLLGFTGTWVESGESLVVTKNNYDLDVYNGEVYRVSGTGSRHTSSVKIANFTNQKERKVSAQYLDLGLGGETLGCKEQISGELGDSFTDSNFERGFRKWAKTQAFKKGGEPPKFLSLAFAYCMTAHKLQGSQAKHGIVVMEKTVKPFGDGRRWVYTALSRSEESVKLFYKE